MAFDAEVTLLGVRGTIPVTGGDFIQYGGATACVLLRLGGETIVLDGGTGLLALERHLLPEERNLHLLLSHPHADHMAGLPACQIFFDSTQRVCIYTAPRGGYSPQQLVERLISPPLWPVGLEIFQAQLTFQSLDGDFSLGAVRVRTMEGVHPGGCTVFRLECGRTSVVYASDYELNERSAPMLEDFARGCTLLLCDGQYTPEELVTRRGFGHSAWPDAARLAQRCGAERLRLLHHAPWRTDLALEQSTAQLQSIFPKGAFAHCGEVLYL